MAEIINIKTDLDKAISLLDNLEKDKTKIRRKILSATGCAVKTKIRKSYKSFLNKHIGTLYKSLKSRVIEGGKKVIVYPAAEKNKVRYGFVLAKGGVIKAKESDFLTFQIDGKWIKKKSVKITPRDWVIEPSKKYLNSSEYKEKLDELIQKEIDKIERIK